MSLETLLEAARYVEQQEMRAAQLRATASAVSPACVVKQLVPVPQAAVPALDHAAQPPAAIPATPTQPKQVQGKSIPLENTNRMFNSLFRIQGS